jgi:hypothetical protein
MTHYPGKRALDAEITINLLEGSIDMDYSLNKFGDPLDSNHSVAINSTFRKLPKKERLMWACSAGGFRISGTLVIMFLMPLFTFLVGQKIITNPKYHYKYQKLLKEYEEIAFGVFEQFHSGQLPSNYLIFLVGKNIWLEYELTGEYKEKIKTISLKRNFVRMIKFGKFPEEKQDGWNLIFEFTEIPTSGSCLVRYV